MEKRLKELDEKKEELKMYQQLNKDILRIHNV
jgi:hypothetical protein